MEDCQKLIDEGAYSSLSLAVGGMSHTTTNVDQTVTQSKSPVSLMMMLIEKNETDKVRLLMEHDDGENAKFALPNGWTCAFTAIKMGNLELLKMLVDQGANLQATAIDGMNLLQYACFKGNREIVQFLLEKGLNPNMRGTSDTPAYFYSCHLPEILKLMLENGADVYLRNNVQGTAMGFEALERVSGTNFPLFPHFRP